MDLGTAGNFVILSKSGISDVPTSTVTGDVGTSPVSGATDHLTCGEVIGKVYSVDGAGPHPCGVTDSAGLATAIGYMSNAYSDASSRTNPDFVDLGNGNIGGMTLVPALYRWNGDVTIPTNITLSGGPTSIWIFQISGNLNVGDGVIIHLTAGEGSKNIFWQVSGQANLGKNSQVQGIILSQGAINLASGALIYGRLLSQNAVSLQSSVVTEAAP